MKIYIYSTTNIMSAKYWYASGFTDINGKSHYVGRWFETTATSIDEAKKNILYKAKQQLYGRADRRLSFIDPNGVEELLDDNPNQPVIDIPHCEKCGTRMSDGMYCPKCYMEDDEAAYNSKRHHKGET